MQKHVTLSLVALMFATAAAAQYKVVGPDGKVTYTDRPGTAAATPVVTSPGGGSTANLPLELRQTVSRYPVTLYAAKDCRSCDTGRQLLQRRGVPFTEKRVESNDDIAALQRLTGGSTLPVLNIGNQQLKGLVANDWLSYLDAAGYPAESRLPANWHGAAATSLAPPKAATPVAPVAADTPSPGRADDTPAPVDPKLPNIRF